MKENFNFTIQILKKHLKSIILFFIMINIVTILSFSVVFNNQIEYSNKQVNYNINEYQEIDNEQLCRIIGCNKVINIKKKKIFKVDHNNHLKLDNYKKYSFHKLYGSLYITNNYQLAVYNKEAESYFIINIDDVIKNYISLIFYFIPFSLFVYIWPFLSSIKSEKEESILINAGSEALLANKSMINITENIHHELNTPLEVIDNKIEKIHNQLAAFLLEEYEATQNIDTIPEDRIHRNRKLVKLNEDFDFIKTSSEQIYAVLEKMKGFKHLRYSNGNKTVKDIIDAGLKIINISNTNFEYKVDHKLNDYRIGNHDLKNAEFLSVILNHLKNSLEACASKVFFVFAKNEKDTLYFRIIDNGNGIPENARKHIFKPNFSTKASDTGIRGNGMYLNKQILKSVGGDINLISTSKKGTTIEISMPCKIKE